MPVISLICATNEALQGGPINACVRPKFEPRASLPAREHFVIRHAQVVSVDSDIGDLENTDGRILHRNGTLVGIDMEQIVVDAGIPLHAILERAGDSFALPTAFARRN